MPCAAAPPAVIPRVWWRQASEWQSVVVCHVLADELPWRDICHIFDFHAICGPHIKVVDFLPACFADFQIFYFALDAQETSSCQRSGNARRAAPGERVKYPRVRLGRCQNYPCQQAQRFLCGMFSARLLPSCDGRQMPDISHLPSTVDELHQFVIVVVWLVFVFPCPDHKLCAVREKATGDIGWRIGLCPCDDVEYPETGVL